MPGIFGATRKNLRKHALFYLYRVPHGPKTWGWGTSLSASMVSPPMDSLYSKFQTDHKRDAQRAYRTALPCNVPRGRKLN